MIGYLEGVVSALRAGYIILSAGGVGYKVALTREALARAKQGSSFSVWTHLAVRENALDLYGFSDEGELKLFEMLISISGIGPKSALAILDIAPAETLRSAIAQGNSGYLTKVSGIGKKTAEKIILELREKVGLAGKDAKTMRGDEEALEAMQSLGYNIGEARDALRKVPSSIEKSSERLREALKILGGGT